MKLIFPDKTIKYVGIGSNIRGIIKDGKRPEKIMIEDFIINDLADLEKFIEWIKRIVLPSINFKEKLQLYERDKILNLLKSRMYGFLDDGKLGRAEILKLLIEEIESGRITDYTYLEDCGLSFNRNVG